MIYTKAQPELSFQDLEKQFRAANFSVYLIANVSTLRPSRYIIAQIT